MSGLGNSTCQRIITALQSPLIVANFQKYFGVELIPSSCNGLGDGDKKRIAEKDQSPSTRTRSHTRVPSDGSIERSTDTSDYYDSSTETNGKTIAYVIRNKFWYYLFSFGAGLGYELFYASFFPIWFWNIDGAVGRRMVLLWVIIMYIGQALKDVVKWPRPSSPPVVSLEPEYAIEYGMPSTHAMVGMALPFSMLIFTFNRYEVSP